MAFAGMPGFLRAMEGMQSMQAMPKLTPNKASPNFKPDVEFDLFCRSSSVSILPGQQTLVQQYAALLKMKWPERDDNGHSRFVSGAVNPFAERAESASQFAQQTG